jgi:hypothetical protein
MLSVIEAFKYKYQLDKLVIARLFAVRNSKKYVLCGEKFVLPYYVYYEKNICYFI